MELLDEQCRPLAGRSGADSAILQKSGLRELATWAGKTSLDGLGEPVRIRLNYVGEQSEEIRVYAVYVAPQ